MNYLNDEIKQKINDMIDKNFTDEQILTVILFEEPNLTISKICIYIIDYKINKFIYNN